MVDRPLVIDWYRAGDGGLEGKLWGLVRLVRARGPETARGEAMRYLAELPWVPQAMAANGELEWRQFDEATVEVATRVAWARVAVHRHFDMGGDIVGASADARRVWSGRRALTLRSLVSTASTGKSGMCECRRRPRSGGSSTRGRSRTSAAVCATSSSTREDEPKCRRRRRRRRRV